MRDPRRIGLAILVLLVGIACFFLGRAYAAFEERQREKAWLENVKPLDGGWLHY